MKASVTPAANLCNFLYTLWLEGKMAGEQPYNVQVKPSIEKMENAHLRTHRLAHIYARGENFSLCYDTTLCRVQGFQLLLFELIHLFVNVPSHCVSTFFNWKGLLSLPDALTGLTETRYTFKYNHACFISTKPARPEYQLTSTETDQLSHMTRAICIRLPVSCLLRGII